MILFDYGRTLGDEPGFDPSRGIAALYNHITKNPDGITLQQLAECESELYRKLSPFRKAGFESHYHRILRTFLDYLGLELDVSIEDAEQIVWSNTSPAERIMPHADELLKYLEENSIRYGIISNIDWSGKALTDRMNRLFPENRFEFIIASSEYGFRKPDRLLFDIALRKAGLPASEVWYCGDSIAADVKGAAAAGIFPVLYEDNTTPSPFGAVNDGLYDTCEYMHIHDWRELMEVLKSYD